MESERARVRCKGKQKKWLQDVHSIYWLFSRAKPHDSTDFEFNSNNHKILLAYKWFLWLSNFLSIAIVLASEANGNLGFIWFPHWYETIKFLGAHNFAFVIRWIGCSEQPQNVKTIVKHEYWMEYPGFYISLWGAFYAMNRVQPFNIYSQEYECNLLKVNLWHNIKAKHTDCNSVGSVLCARHPNTNIQTHIFQSNHEARCENWMEKKFFQLEKLRKRIN